MSKIDIVADELICLLENGSITVEEALNVIDKLILTDIALAERIISEIKRNTNLSGNVLVSYLSNKIREKKFFDGMSDVDREKYLRYLEMGRAALKTKNSDKAFSIFSEGYLMTKHPVFKYYMGKSAFYQGKLEHSTRFFYQYLMLGSEKLGKANLYLLAAARKRQDLREKSYRMALLYYAPKIFDSERAFDDLLANLDNPPNRNRIFPENIIVTRNSSNCFLEEKLVVEEKNDSDITVEMFSGLDEELFDNFHSFGFEEQMRIIRELYLNGNIFGADRLMLEVETSAIGNPKRQRVIKQEKVKDRFMSKIKK